MDSSCSSGISKNMSSIAFLKEQVPLFQDFSAERLQQLQDGSRSVSFEEKEAIMHRGEEASHFGVVLSGTIAASVLGAGVARHSLGQLQAGDTSNEMALMTGD